MCLSEGPGRELALKVGVATKLNTFDAIDTAPFVVREDTLEFVGADPLKLKFAGAAGAWVFALSVLIELVFAAEPA